MSADNLPRPSTPGQWLRPKNPNLAAGGVILAPDGRAQVAQCAPEMVPVLLALPERIRRMDAVRAWAESVLLASADEDGPEIAALRNAARHVLDLLDDRPTDGQKETHATT